MGVVRLQPSHRTPDLERWVVATGACATAAAVRDWIEAQFGVDYTRGSMHTLLPRLGIRRQGTPAPPHTGRSPDPSSLEKEASGNTWPRSA